MDAPRPEPYAGELPAVRAPGLRPDVAVFPASTYAAFLALVLAEVAVGAFLGNWLFNEVLGAAWVRTLADCLASNQADPQGTFACYAGIERTRGVWSIAGAAVVVGLGLIAMALAPRWIRRRRALRALGEAHQAVRVRLAAASASIGLRTAPTLYFGPLRQRDAFSFGAYGRYAIAIPRALASNGNAALFEGVIRHELAHVRNRDVGFSWLANSIWYVVGPLLVIPVVWGLITLEPSLLPDYIPRAVVIAAVVWVAARNLIRVREWEADLTAARGGADALALAERTASRATATATHPVRRFLAAHPSVESRMSVLRSPERATIVGFSGSAVVGLLVAFAAPMVEQVSQASLAGGDTLWSITFSAVVVGAILGSSVGLGIWRNVHAEGAASLAEPGTRRSHSRLAAAGGLVAGMLVGEALSLRHIGIPIGDWLALTGLIPAFALGSTVAVSASLASVFILGVGRRGIRVVGLIANIALFGLAWWLSRSLQTAWDLMGWELFAPNAAILLGANGGWPVAALVVAIGCAGLVGLALRRETAPRWWFEGTHATSPTARSSSASTIAFTLIGGTSVGLACAVIAFVRWSMDESLRAAGPGAIDTVVLITAVGATCWSLGAALALRSDGPTVGLVGGMFVIGSGSVGGAIIVSTASGVVEPASLWSLAVGTALTCALPLGMLGILIGAAPGVLTPAVAVARPRWRAAAPAVAAIAGLLMAGTLIPAAGGSSPQPPTTLEVTPEEYVYGYAPGYVDSYARLRTAVASAVDAYPARPDEAVEFLRDQVLPEYRAFADSLTAVDPGAPDLAEAHGSLEEAVAEMTAAVEECTQAPSTMTCVDALTEPTHATELENTWIDIVSRAIDEL